MPKSVTRELCNRLAGSCLGSCNDVTQSVNCHKLLIVRALRRAAAAEHKALTVNDLREVTNTTKKLHARLQPQADCAIK